VSEVRARHRSLLLRLAVALLATLFCAAPVPGDVGGCGRAPSSLDATQFFDEKAALDCVRCTECEITSRACDVACDRDAEPRSLPRGCDPLQHDGDVCLRRLVDATCDEYEAFLRDEAPETPTECNFCPRPGR
jgi:hypothetical protein